METGEILLSPCQQSQGPVGLAPPAQQQGHPLRQNRRPPCITKIAKIRKEAAIQVQLAVANELDRKATTNDKDSITILRTGETLLQDSNTCTLDAAKQKLTSLVGKENAALIKQLEKQTDFLKDHQRPDPDFALGQFTFPEKFEAGSRPALPLSPRTSPLTPPPHSNPLTTAHLKVHPPWVATVPREKELM